MYLRSYSVNVKGNVLALVTVSIHRKDGKDFKRGDYIARFRAEAEATLHEDGEYIDNHWRDDSLIEIKDDTIKPEDCFEFTIINRKDERRNNDFEYISCVKQVFDEELTEIIY